MVNDGQRLLGEPSYSLRTAKICRFCRLQVDIFTELPYMDVFGDSGLDVDR